MKKIILAIITLVIINACSCNQSKKNYPAIVSNINAEELISLDRQDMYLTYGEDYRWYETSITLKEFMDSENADSLIESISNIFQTLIASDDGTDVHVVMRSHYGDTVSVKVLSGFWVEDFPLNNESITLTFTDAYNKLMETNIPKPHSRQVVLRKEVGPIDANPQWIFGNIKQHVYVDAVTGNVTINNPAFPEDTQLNYAFTW